MPPAGLQQRLHLSVRGAVCMDSSPCAEAEGLGQEASTSAQGKACMVVRNSFLDLDEPKEARVTKCPGGHALEAWKATCSVICDGCGVRLCFGAPVMGCRVCNWDLCSRCFSQEEEIPL